MISVCRAEVEAVKSVLPWYCDRSATFINNTTLITDWSGTPNVAGRALRAYLVKNNGR